MAYKRKGGKPRRGRRTFKKKSFRKKGRGRKSKRSSGTMTAVKLMKKITEPIDFRYDYAQRVISHSANVAAGDQTVFYLCAYNDSVDISLMHNRLQTRLNAPTSNALNKFAVGGFKGTYKIKNLSNNDCDITIYKVMARNDMDATLLPNQPISQGNTITTADAISQLINGYAQAIGVSPSGINRLVFPIGISPFQVNTFCMYFKILGKPKTHRMVGGAYHTFRVRDPKWRLWNGSKVAGCTGAPSGVSDVAFGKRTVWYICMATGAPVVTASNLTNISTSAIDLGLVVNERYRYTGLQNAQATINVPLTDFGTFTDASTIVERTGLKTAGTDA